jgi:hypothetical protein
MTLIPGMLLSFDDPVVSLIPNVIVFQYNPGSITRVFTPPTTRDVSTSGGPGRAQAVNAHEAYSLTLEFDATDGLEREGPVTTRLGIAPRLAALELLMQPRRGSPLAKLVQTLGKRRSVIPASRVPLVIMVWGPARIAPVMLDSLTITETSFDELLNPIHAQAEVGFSVIRPDDAEQFDKLAQSAANYYQSARETLALLSIAQLVELTSPADLTSQLAPQQVVGQL